MQKSISNCTDLFTIIVFLIAIENAIFYKIYIYIKRGFKQLDFCQIIAKSVVQSGITKQNRFSFYYLLYIKNLQFIRKNLFFRIYGFDVYELCSFYRLYNFHVSKFDRRIYQYHYNLPYFESKIDLFVYK